MWPGLWASTFARQHSAIGVKLICSARAAARTRKRSLTSQRLRALAAPARCKYSPKSSIGGDMHCIIALRVGNSQCGRKRLSIALADFHWLTSNDSHQWLALAQAQFATRAYPAPQLVK